MKDTKIYLMTDTGWKEFNLSNKKELKKRNILIVARSVIGAGSSIGAGAIIGARSVIGAGSSIGAGAIIGARAIIGEGSSIGARASIGEGSSIGAGASIVARSVIGAGSSIGVGSRIKKIIHIANIGNTKSTCAYTTENGEQIITTGCFIGTIEKFREQVERKYEKPHDYYLLIDFIEKWFEQNKE